MKNIVVFLYFLLLTSQAIAASVNEQLADLRRQCAVALKEMRFDDALMKARTMLSLTDTINNTSSIEGTNLRFIALAFAGQTYVAADKYDSAYVFLSQGLDLFQKNIVYNLNSEISIPVYTLFNSLGIYYMDSEMDYANATASFIQGLNIASEYSTGNEYAILGHNLIMSYFMAGNPAGLKYAMSMYKEGDAHDDDLMKFVGSYGLAMMYYLKADFEEAERYIVEAIKYDESVYYMMGTNNLYALILSQTGRDELAEEYFRKAIDYLDTYSATTAVFVCLSYGNFLNLQNRLQEAVEILNKGLDIAVKRNNKIFIVKLYNSLSNVYEKSGDLHKSLYYYKRYGVVKDSIFTIEKERTMNELTLKYETARQEAMLKEYELNIEKKNRIMQAFTFTIIVVLIILFVIFLMYRNKNRMYTTIARQYKEAISKVKAMEDKLHQKESPALTDEKANRIFSTLEKLMSESKIFKDSSLTREKVAELTNTNRTYLSKVIVEKTGKTFNQYISSYRVSEALMILSDVENDSPLRSVSVDSGFCSLSNFFKQFKDEVGMTPAKYREKIIELSKMKSVEGSDEL